MLSILFRRAEQAVSGLAVEQPSCFVDLNLDQLVATLTAGRKDYNLEPFLYSLLRDVDDVSYRHEVFQDLEQEFLFDSVKSFAAAMHSMRQHLLYAEKLDYRYEKMRWQLEAIDEYCGALQALSRNLEQAQIRSRALSRMRDYVRDCVGSVSFLSQQAEAAKLKEELAGIRYCLLVDGLTVRVRRYEAEKDHASEVEKTFAKFRHDAQQSYLAEFQHSRNLNHVEAMALDCVARVFPGAFLRLADFCERNREFPDPTIVNFDREVQLYLSYLELTSMLRRAGLPFCYPRLCMADGESFSVSSENRPSAALFASPTGTRAGREPFPISKERASTRWPMRWPSPPNISSAFSICCAPNWPSISDVSICMRRSARKASRFACPSRWSRARARTASTGCMTRPWPSPWTGGS
jgi:DNA mismatch repair protein MutS